MNRTLFAVLAMAAEKKPSIDTAVDQDVSSSLEPWAEVTPVIKFGPSFMTDSRARSITEEAGFTFIRWAPCSGNTADCVVIEAQGNRGHVFQYHLIHQMCLSVGLGPPPRVGDAGDRLGSRRSAPSSRSRTAKPGTGTIEQIERPTLDTPDEEEGEATDCFGGYRAPTRARLDHFFAADHLGYILTTDQTHQTIENGRWTD
jgi:hypothetical protein